MTGPLGASYQLGVDLGCASTKAATAVDGEVRILELGDRTATMPSIVYVGADGTFSVGHSAARRAHSEPDRVAGDIAAEVGASAPRLIGGVPCSSDRLLAELLEAVLRTAQRTRGSAPASVTLTHPHGWTPFQIDAMQQAARMAGCTSVQLLAEPEAAVNRLASVLDIPETARILVYDHGSTMVRSSVVQWVDGAAVAPDAEATTAAVGGDHLDELVYHHILAQAGVDEAALDQADPMVASTLRRLADECRDAREALSGVPEVSLPVLVPGAQVSVGLTTDDLNALIADSVEVGLATLEAAMAPGGSTWGDIDVVLAVGGVSTTPHIARRLGEVSNGRLVELGHLGHVIALGAAEAAVRRAAVTAPAADEAPDPEPVAAPPDPTVADRPTVAPPPTEPPAVVSPQPPAAPPPAAAPPTVVVPPGSEGQAPQPAAARPAAGATNVTFEAVPLAESLQPPQPAEPDRGRGPWIIAAVGALALVIGVVAFLLTSGGNDDPAQQAEGGPSEPTAAPEPTPAPEAEPSTDDGAPVDPGDPTPEPEPTAVPEPEFDIGEPIRTVAVGMIPDLPTEVDGILWVPNAGDGTISRFDPMTGEVRSIPVGANPDTILFAADALWIPVRDDEQLVRLDPATETQIVVEVGPNADTPVFAAGLVWLPVRDARRLLGLDPVTAEILVETDLGGRPLTPIVDPTDGLWFVTRDDNALNVIDLDRMVPGSTPEIEQIPVGADPDRPILAEGLLWVPNRDDATISVVDPATRSVVATVPVGERPDTPVASPGLIWVPNQGGSTVTVIDAMSRSVVAEIQVGAGPRTGVAAPAHVWIPVRDGSTVVGLDVATQTLDLIVPAGAEPDTPALVGDRIWVPSGGDALLVEIFVG